MNKFEAQIKVSAEDLDELNHVNNVQYVNWVNDVAKWHWEKNATETILNKYYWVVLNHTIVYKSSALLNDKLDIITFVKKSKGVKSTRIVEIYNSKTNKQIIQSETIWCLMDRNSNRPTRIPSEIINLFH